MSDSIKVYTSEDITPEKLSQNRLTLVDFWATWCGPCRMMAPIVESLAEQLPDVVFAKVDVDENPDVAMGLGISSIHTLILFKDGQIAERVIGVTPEKELRMLIDKHR